MYGVCYCIVITVLLLCRVTVLLLYRCTEARNLALSVILSLSLGAHAQQGIQ